MSHARRFRLLALLPETGERVGHLHNQPFSKRQSIRKRAMPSPERQVSQVPPIGNRGDMAFSPAAPMAVSHVDRVQRYFKNCWGQGLYHHTTYEMDVGPGGAGCFVMHGLMAEPIRTKLESAELHDRVDK